jgi:hypothetical protein
MAGQNTAVATSIVSMPYEFAFKPCNQVKGPQYRDLDTSGNALSPKNGGKTIRTGISYIAEALDAYLKNK